MLDGIRMWLLELDTDVVIIVPVPHTERLKIK